MKNTIFLNLILVLLLSACGKNVDFKNPSNPSPGPMAPAPQIKLNPDLGNNQQVTDKFVATPDGSKIVYISDQDTDGKNELYVVNPDSTGKMKISPAILFGRNVLDFKVSPSSSLVAFRMDSNIAGAPDLFTVNLDGTNLHQVNVGSPSGRQVFDTYRFMPNSLKLVYVTDEAGAANDNELIIANTDGTGRVKLNQANPAREVFEIASNGSRIVYRQGTTNPEVRSVLPTGLGQVLLNDPFNLGLNPASGVTGMVVSLNSVKVVFRTNQASSGASYDLVAVNIDGTGARTKINGNLVSNGSVEPSAGIDYQITADSSKVVYRADQQTDNDFELYQSDITLGTSSNVKINGVLATNGDVVRFKLASNSVKVVYLADEQADGINEVYSSNLNGTSKFKLNSSISLGGKVADFEISPNAGHVAYAMDKNGSGIFNLYSQVITGSAESQLNAPVVGPGVGVYDITQPTSRQFQFTPDSLKMVFRASLSQPDFDLFQSDLLGNQMEKISILTPGQDVLLKSTTFGTDFAILPNGQRVVYRIPTGSVIDLYSRELP